jgi:hypothetical protein
VLMVDEVAGDIFCRLGGGPETTSLGLELAILGLASSCLLEIHPVTKRRCSRQSKTKYSLFEWYKSDYLKNHFVLAASEKSLRGSGPLVDAIRTPVTPLGPPELI